MYVSLTESTGVDWNPELLEPLAEFTECIEQTLAIKRRSERDPRIRQELADRIEAGKSVADRLWFCTNVPGLDETDYSDAR
jgi:hypothetical protein